MPDTSVESDLLGGFEGMDGCGRNVLHLIAWEETAEVEGRLSKTVADDPFTHLSNHLHIIIDSWYHKVGKLNPYTSLLHGEDGVEHWL